MAFNYSKLKGRIKEVYDTQENFANAIGLSLVSVSNKLNNKTQWTQKEINNACAALKIDDCEVSSYFFTIEVKEA
jgi:hypothetical protein